MSILWDWRVIIIQRLKSGLIHRGVSRADQRDLGEYRTKNVKSCSLSNTETRQSLGEHLDVLRGEPDQSARNKDGLGRWSDLSCISLLSLTLLSPVFIYLPEPLGAAAPVSVFPACLCCWLDCLNINEALSPMYYKHERTVIKDDISKPHSLPLSSLLFFTGDRSLLDNIWKAWRMANDIP